MNLSLKLIIVIALALVVYLMVPGVRPFIERKWLELRHQNELQHQHYLESQGKIDILVSDSEL